MTVNPHDERHPNNGGASPVGDGAPRVHRWEELAVAEDHAGWIARSRIVLTPMAAPSIMGLFGFMIGTAMLGAWQAGWYGSAATPLIIWPLAMVAGGVMQSIAAVASLRARDGAATAAHTAWGSFWIGWGVLQICVLTGLLPIIPLGAVNTSFAFWFIVLALVTIWSTFGAMAENILMTIVLGTLSAASALTAAGFWAGSLGTLRAGGWIFVVSAAAAWLAAGAMTLEHSFGRTIIPVGKWSRRGNIPGVKATDPIAYPAGMPGVKVGQ